MKRAYAIFLFLMTMPALVAGQCKKGQTFSMPEPTSFTEIPWQEDREYADQDFSLRKLFMQRDGRLVAMIQLYPQIDDPVIARYLKGLMANLVALAPESARRFQYDIVLFKADVKKTEQWGGGLTGMTLGQLADARSEDVIAVILSHEIGHTALRHPIVRKLFKERNASSATADAAVASLERSQEREADIFGTLLALKAGYNPSGIVADFRRAASNAEAAQRADLMTCIMRGETRRPERQTQEFLAAREQARRILLKQ